MKFQSIRGVKDILPGDIAQVQRVEEKSREVFRNFGFSEIRIPIFEATEVFSRGIGTSTDIVEKEMYTFTDRSGDKLTLRPEGTASVVRAFVEHQLHLKKPVTKLYYMGPMFRYERPQAGRYRQFYQIGIEALGTESSLMDVEILTILHLILSGLGIAGLQMEINSLGNEACRPAYREALIHFLKDHLEKLCEDCHRRYETNPLRILDCKREGCRKITAGAPSTLDHLCPDCLDHFEAVKEGLDQLKVPYKINDRLVRGLDYYMRTAFEVTASGLGAQNAIAAGGRYDGLVKQLGGPPTPGIGFAMGLERIASLIGMVKETSPDIFFAMLGDKARHEMLPIITQLRLEGLQIEMDYGNSALKKQMTLSNKLGSRFTLIVGDNELQSRKAVLRNMETKEQQTFSLDSLIKELRSIVKSLG